MQNRGISTAGFLCRPLCLLYRRASAPSVFSFSSLCPISYKNTTHMGVRSSHMTPFYLNHLCKGLSSNSHILRYYRLGIQSTNSERTQFSLLHPLASILKRWHIHSSPGIQPGSTAQLAAHCSHTIFHRPGSCLHLQRQNTMASRNVPNISMISILITHNQPLLKPQRTASLMLEKSMADIL